MMDDEEVPEHDMTVEEKLARKTAEMEDEKTRRQMTAPMPLTADVDIAWSKVKRLLMAFHSLEEDEPKLAASVLGKAHKAAVAWSRMVEPDSPS